MTSQEIRAAVAAYTAKGGTVKSCPPANARGNETVGLSRAAVNEKRRVWRRKAKKA